ncbi:MAG: hypothetical protein GF411_16960 [Candidatus Lokiarchaeota archaeon]|nr:hypothetical protein [Candidatus Lokiarchaeota archaeon]
MFQNDEAVLEFLGIDLNSVNIDILTAIIQTQGLTGSTFNDIMSKLHLLRGKKANESLVYRGLSELQKIGLVTIDESGYKHIYNTGFDHLDRVLRERLPESINRLRAELRSIEQSQKELKQVDTTILAQYLIEILTGEKQKRKSRFALGAQSILRLISSEVFNVAGNADTIRMSLGWGGTEMDCVLLDIENIQELTSAGVELRVLVPHDWKVPSSLLENIRGLSDREKIWFRRRIHTHATYQFVSLNDNSLIMVTSEEPLSASYIPHYLNHVIILDALRTFDREFFDASLTIEVLP